MKKGLSLSLFWKFTIAIAATVALFGSINLYFLNYAVYDLFEKELTRHGLTTGANIAERCVDPLLYDDLAALNFIVSETKRIDSAVAYVFILDKNNQPLAHTFETAVPLQLRQINIPENPGENSIMVIEGVRHDRVAIRDMAIPILEGNLGTVRLGLYEENYFSSIRGTTRVFLFMVLLFLAFGIIGAFLFSYVIATPIKAIADTADKLDLKTIQGLNLRKDDLTNLRAMQLKNFLNVRDEIDILVSRFEEMALRLQSAYSELQRTQMSLFQSEKMASLGVLSAGIAHEINNPIAGMQNCLRRLSDAPENVKQNKAYLEMMQEAVNKIEKVVSGILNYSRKREMTFEKVSLCDATENALALTSYQLEKANISVEKNYPPEAAFVKASQNHLEQVVLNMLLNSIDAIVERKQKSPELKGAISIEIRRAGDYLELEISDNGVGVPESQLNYLFDPFFTMKKVRQGTGLGLSISYNIIQQHGGKITASVKKEGGMRFIVTLPEFTDA